MALLSVLFLLWGVPLLNATGRLRSFHLINTEMPINEALNVCRRNYTDLATIYDEKENKELYDILNSVSGERCGWIGASSCKWSNGDAVTFTKYSASFTENCCGAINTDERWKCSKCNSVKMYFLCYDQDPGQQSHNYSLIRENKTWTEAQLFCRENHTDLVIIRNEMENERVKKAVNKSNLSFWINFQYNQSSLYWLDGGRSDYTQNSSSKACFTYLSKSEPRTWVKGNNGDECNTLCYKSFIHVSDNEMSWEEALDYCDIHYSGLLSIQSENDQIETERELKRRSISGPVWVGLRQSRLFGFWIWTNGLQVGPWTNWKGGSQPEHQISQHCGAIEKEADGQYKWSDKDCRIKFTFLCERK